MQSVKRAAFHYDSLSGEYNFMFKGKSNAGGEGKQEGFKIGECSDQYQREEHDVNGRQEAEVGGLSLELSLGFNDISVCTSKERERMENPSSARRVASDRNKRNKVEREEARMLVSTSELRLGLDPWCIKKKLTGSDLGDMSRLMLASECVEYHVFPSWNADQLKKIKEGLPVSVWDCDTQTEHELVFKRWNKRANVFIKNWVKDFEKRRELKVGDEIGLGWDTCNSRFQFSVLSRVATN